MKQVFQSLATGKINFFDLPAPKIKDNEILIKTNCSLISSGTERMLAEFGRSNLFSKAKQQPDKLKEAVEHAKLNGFLTTFEAISDKLEKPIQLGYCNVGIVIKVGKSVKNFVAGDRVLSNGAHSELVCVSQKLCAKIPDNVSDNDAVFTVLASIGLQGIRLCKPTLGETFVVSGLGLIGLLTAQLLKANGLIVFGIDPDIRKCKIAESFGIETFSTKDNEIIKRNILNKTDNFGVDGVLITASTTSSEPINLAAEITRKKGRLVLVGVTGLSLRRDLLYKKEISFQVSCSYGPGRYDPLYENDCIDYPIGHVRWTENRNFTAILNLLSESKINTKKLVSHTFEFERISEAYDLLVSDSLVTGILIKYKNKLKNYEDTINLVNHFHKSSNKTEDINIGFIGAGNYASRTLIPAFIKNKPNFYILGAESGHNSIHIGKKYGFKKVTTNIKKLILHKETNLIVISTRHDSHAKLVIESLKANKHVFVEKPLCLNKNEFNLIKKNINSEKLLMVGFNRRFSPLIKFLDIELNKINTSKNFIYTCNSGSLPSEHWSLDLFKGGGRFLGEACHFVDLLRFLAKSPIIDFQLLPKGTNKMSQTFDIFLKFENGSTGCIHYLANGSKSFAKERLEVFSGGKIFQLDNFLKLRAWGVKGFKEKRLFKQDKGQLNCVKMFLDAIKNGTESPIPLDQILEVQYNLLNCIEK